MIMNAFQTTSVETNAAEAAAAAFARLMANLPGFVYRSRADSSRTMEFVSERCRDVTGYDPHRFIGNQSLTYGLLIHPDDRSRVDRTVFEAAQSGRRFTCDYRIRTACGSVIEVVDRGVGVLDETGVLRAIEGYVDRACEGGLQTSVWSAEHARPAAADFGGNAERIIGDDDATAELIDRLLPTWTQRRGTASAITATF